MRVHYLFVMIACATLVVVSTKQVQAQAFGIELHNTLMPASGAMGGASIARPQDVQSAVAGNPATLAQFYGTQFSTGGAWVEPTFNMQHTGAGVLPGLSPFSAKSEAEGSALGGFALVQDLRALGIPVTVGTGLFGSAGAGLSFNDVPASNGTSAFGARAHTLGERTCNGIVGCGRRLRQRRIVRCPGPAGRPVRQRRP